MDEMKVAEPNGRRDYTVKEKANEEASKLFAFKHLTTLSTGAILILATLLETVFPNPQWSFLIIIVLTGFIVSTVGAVRMMFHVAGSVMELREQTTTAERVGFLITTLGFLVGIIGFVVFAVRNFYA
jgi:hypothetical protein